MKRYSRISFTYLFFASVDFVNDVTSSGPRVRSLNKWWVTRFEVRRDVAEDVCWYATLKLRVILCFVTSVNTSDTASHSRRYIFRAERYLNK